ncbi:helix-turn-helix transcriptional regulator [Pelotomaculum sp. FP]|nr:helix-turn-helix transcriptional regulator [Pelotomaculum sp. FP]
MGKNLSQKDVADAVGVTRQTINAIENGDYSPTINLITQYKKFLDSSIE